MALVKGRALVDQDRALLNATDRTRVRARVKYMLGDRGPVGWTRDWIVGPNQIEHVSVVGDQLPRARLETGR
jgi:hypothetical protein